MPEITYTISPTLNKNKVFILHRSEIEKRLDPQFYKQDFKDNIAKIKKVKHKRLGEVVKFSREVWNQKDFFNSTFPYIEIGVIDTLSGEIQNISQINIENAPSRAKMVVRENDIIISTTRPNRGAISLIRQPNDFSIASTGFSVIRDITNHEINREYLFAVIRQQIILKQFEQRSSGGNYPAITQEELNNVVIPIPEINKQEKIIAIFKTYFEQKKQNEAQAEKLLASIDDYLLIELGIDLPKPPENILKNRLFITTIKEISGRRFDPNYHQSNHKENYISFHKSKFQTQFLKDITESIFQGVGRNIDENSEYVLLKVKNIKQSCEIDYEDTEKIGDFKTSKLLKKGDIITPCIGEAVRQIKFVVFENENGKYLVDNNTCVIRPNKKVNSNFINYCLCSSIGRLQINRLIGGGGVPFLGADNLKKFIISVPPLARQEEIAEHITTIRKQAQQLKNKTKEAMEKAGKEIESILLS